MAANRKRYWIITGLVALLVLTIYLNYRLNVKETGEEEPTLEAMANAELALEPVPLVTPPMQIEVGSGAPAPEEELALEASAGFFVTFKRDRDSVRERELEVLESIIASSATGSEQISEAQTQKLSIVDSMEKEMTIEGMIKAKGFMDAAVTIHKGSVNIVVDKDTLENSDVAQILDIAQRESGEKPENIKIMPRS